MRDLAFASPANLDIYARTLKFRRKKSKQTNKQINKQTNAQADSGITGENFQMP